MTPTASTGFLKYVRHFSKIIFYCNRIIEKSKVPNSAVILTPSANHLYGYGNKSLKPMIIFRYADGQ
jgi:hypothetical protein